MNRAAFARLAGGTLAAAPLAARAAAPGGKPLPSEQSFVAEISADLPKRFPTAAAAVAAGFIRFTDEDDTGAISYANRVWTSVDPRHPSQLWYDVHGRILGADFSVPFTTAPPHRFGLDPSRWTHLGAHVHYGLVAPGGGTTYGATGVAKIVRAGGSGTNPLPRDLVAAKIAASVAAVRFVFLFPSIWDASVWVVPNPAGAFADRNPLVTPTKS